MRSSLRQHPSTAKVGEIVSSYTRDIVFTTCFWHAQSHALARTARKHASSTLPTHAGYKDKT